MKTKQKYIPLVSVDQLVTYIDYIEKFEPTLIPAMYNSGIPQAIKEHSGGGYICREVALSLFDLFDERMTQASMVKMLTHACKVNTDKLLASVCFGGTLKYALESICTELSIHSTDTVFSLERIGEHYWLHRVRQSKDNLWGGRVTLLMMINLVQKLTQSDWVPGQVTSIYDRGEPLQPFLSRHRIHYAYNEKHTGILIPASLMATMVTAGDSQMNVSAQEPLQTFRSSLKEMIKPYLSTSLPTLDQVAASLKISARTLQRRLQSESLSYSEVLSEAIDEMACRALISTDSTVTSISFNMGYSCASHFTRAFKRKFGMTPTEYRELHR